MDVAKMEGKGEDFETTHFPVNANFGAQRADLSVSSGAKANATTHGSSGAKVSTSTLLTTVKEELTIIDVLSHDSGLFRAPVLGDTFKTRPNGKGAAGGTLPRCKAFFMEENGQLEQIAELPSNTTFGPCSDVRYFAVGGGTVSVRVPLPLAFSIILLALLSGFILIPATMR